MRLVWAASARAAQVTDGGEGLKVSPRNTEYASRYKYGKIHLIILAALPQKGSE